MNEQDDDILMRDAGIKSTDASGKVLDTTKQLLQWLYNTKSERLTLRPNIKGKNRLLWRQFRLAYLDNLEQPYAMCCECLTFVKYSGRTGTGGLVRHHCFRRAFASLEFTQPVRAAAPNDHPKPASSSPNRLEVENLVLHNSPRIGYVPNYKGKSDVWAQFDIITVDNETVNFAACKLCRSIVTYVSRTGTGSMTRHKCQRSKRRSSSPGPDVEAENLSMSVKKEPAEDSEDSGRVPTSSPPAESNIMELHLKAFSDLLQSNLQNFRTKMEPRSPTPPTPRLPTPPHREPPEDAVRRQYLGMVRRSLDVFHAMRNDVFFDMAQTLVNIGAEYGKIDIRQVLVDAADLDTVFDAD